MENRREHSAAGILGKGFTPEAEFGQHFHGRRMDGGGALILGRFRFGLEEGDRDAFLDQSERRHRAHGPGPDHDHPIIVLHHPLLKHRTIRPVGSASHQRPSSPRKRGPITTASGLWVPACAGTTVYELRSRYQTFEISNIEGWNNSSAATLRSIRPCSWAYCVNAVISRMFSSMP